MHYSDMSCLATHTLVNIFEKTENVSLVSHLNVGFHEDDLTYLLFTHTFMSKMEYY